VTDRVLAAKGRVGVYLGVWQASTLGTSPSAYGVLGSASTAVLAARVANTYDFQGPALTVTAQMLLSILVSAANPRLLNLPTLLNLQTLLKWPFESLIP
jgi:hypothetical protein